MYNKCGIEDFPNNVSMRRMYGYFRKEFSDLLGPLRAFLSKAAREGRSFNSVYSEIKKVLNGNGVLQQHVLEHVFDNLYFKNEDGTYYQKGKNRSGEPVFRIDNGKLEMVRRWGGVMSQDFILIDNDIMSIYEYKLIQRKPKKEKTNINGKEIMKSEGIWYWIKEKEIKCGVWGNYQIFKLTQISKKDLAKYDLI